MGMAKYALLNLYCGKCCRWIRLEDTVWRDRRPLCPHCGNTLRISCRNTRNKDRRLFNRLKREILEYYELHHRVPDFNQILIKKKGVG